MLTISALEVDPGNKNPSDNSQTRGDREISNRISDDQREADEYIKNKIKKLLNPEEEPSEIHDISGVHNSISSRRSRRAFWKNVYNYFAAGGILFFHFAVVYACKFASYKFISNKDVMSFKRR